MDDRRENYNIREIVSRIDYIRQLFIKGDPSSIQKGFFEMRILSKYSINDATNYLDSKQSNNKRNKIKKENIIPKNIYPII